MAIPQLRPPDEPDHPAAIEPVGGASIAPVPVVPRVPIHKEDPNKQIQLDRMKRRATGLLVGATVLFIVSLLLERQFPWLGFVRATAEAAMVGGLADWFAITVLFRHPLGIPIPHTAIIPKNKDRIGRSLGSFVERNFLVPEVILPKLRQADLTGRLAGWLVAPENASIVADRITTLLKRFLTTGDIAHSELIQHAVGEQLRRLDLAPLLARVIEVLTGSKDSDVLFEKLTQTIESWMATHRTQIDEMVAQHSRWWIPKTIDRRIAAEAVEGTIDLLHRLRQRDSDVRQQFRAAVTKLG